MAKRPPALRAECSVARAAEAVRRDGRRGNGRRGDRLDLQVGYQHPAAAVWALTNWESTMTTTRQYRFLLLATLGFVTVMGCSNAGFWPWKTAAIATSADGESADSKKSEEELPPKEAGTGLYGRR